MVPLRALVSELVELLGEGLQVPLGRLLGGPQVLLRVLSLAARAITSQEILSLMNQSSSRSNMKETGRIPSVQQEIIFGFSTQGS